MLKFILGVAVGVQFSDEILNVVRPLAMKYFKKSYLRYQERN